MLLSVSGRPRRLLQRNIIDDACMALQHETTIAEFTGLICKKRIARKAAMQFLLTGN
jgi:hypothetical protein